MKKIALSIGITLIILLLGIWVYLLFFSTSTSNNDLFSLFNFGDSTDSTISTTEPDFEEFTNNDEPVVDVSSPELLRQLTTRKTIGHQLVTSSTSARQLVYFAEAGTGHIYTIDLTAGEEIRVSNITVPMARQAAISENGAYAAVSSGEGLSSELVFITLPTETNTLDSWSLTEPSDNFAFSSDGMFMYSKVTTSGTLGRVYNPVSATSKTLFEIPFRESVIDWGENTLSAHYAYPKPTSGLQGFLYAVNANGLRRLPAAGYGLSSTNNDGFSLYSVKRNGEYKARLINYVYNTDTELPYGFIPEKCVLSEESTGFIVCAHTDGVSTKNFPDVWYRGEVESQDKIWIAPLSNPSAFASLDPMSLTGRALDVTNMKLDDNMLFFTNRYDQSLWLYDGNIN